MGENNEQVWKYLDTSICLETEDKDSNAFRGVIEAAIRLNQKFYNSTPSQIKITTVGTKSDWEARTRQYAHLDFAWGVTLDDGAVVIKSKEFIAIDDDRFERLIAHEINHSFWAWNYGRRGAGWNPNWIVEGLANLAAPARDLIDPKEALLLVKKKGLNATALEYQYIDKSGEDDLIFYYSLWRAIVSDLILRCGHKDLNECLEEYLKEPTEVGFEREFKRQFRETLQEYFYKLLSAG